MRFSFNRDNWVRGIGSCTRGPQVAQTEPHTGQGCILSLVSEQTQCANNYPTIRFTLGLSSDYNISPFWELNDHPTMRQDKLERQLIALFAEIGHEVTFYTPGAQNETGQISPWTKSQTKREEVSCPA